jgi:hypothetical protein
VIHDLLALTGIAPDDDPFWDQLNPYPVLSTVSPQLDLGLGDAYYYHIEGGRS